MQTLVRCGIYKGRMMELTFEYSPVNTKHDFVRRYKNGEFGNAAPTWDNISEFLQSGYDGGLIHVRNRVASGPTWYDVEPRNVPGVWERACMEDGCVPESLYLSAMAPTEKTIIQGEVQQGVNGLDLFFTTVAKPMRDALADTSSRVEGVMASLLVRGRMNPISYDWLQILLNRYPDHVVEFSCYDCNWGTLPGYNTVFWEVRKY